ncbi:SAM-dependent methyltransferase [Nonomuraea sp. NPDC049725]|uniref:SAM-dependent methyltransferase n=1 Tax=Nonomuraea sp. NPDC049725 TaxID=3154508 RepID=UPI003414A502
MSQFDPRTPNLARMYDYLLGGTDNYAVDREAIDRLSDLIPEAVPLARANRGFLQRAARYVAAEGVGQFVGLGSGLPTRGNVHEVVPGAKVVYVDHDPVVAEHARELLADEPRAVFAEADPLDAGEVLARAKGFLDLSRPVAVFLVSMPHGGRDPGPALSRLREAVAPGSYVALTHAASGDRRDGTRSPAEIRAFFGDFALVPPGLVQAAEWRPDRPRLVGGTPLPSYLLAGLAMKK